MGKYVQICCENNKNAIRETRDFCHICEIFVMICPCILSGDDSYKCTNSNKVAEVPQGFHRNEHQFSEPAKDMNSIFHIVTHDPANPQRNISLKNFHFFKFIFIICFIVMSSLAIRLLLCFTYISLKIQELVVITSIKLGWVENTISIKSKLCWTIFF